MTETLRHKALASQPHTLPSPTSHRSIQSLSKSVSAPPHGQKEKIKHGHTTKPIRNAGFGGNLKVKSFNKLIGKRTVKCLENPHYA